MSYKVLLTASAKEDLRSIAFAIAEKSKSKSLAKAFVAELYSKCSKLNAFPNRANIPRDRILRSAGYRFIVHKDCLIFYLVDEACATVNILAIFNAKLDYMRVMRKYI